MNRFQSWYGMQPRGLRALITINVVIYVIWLLFFSRFDGTYLFITQHLALHPTLPELLLEPWQLVTYNFLHLGTGFWDGLLHIGFNMLWLYWIGQEYEQLHGPAPVTAIYLIGGVGGGLLSLLWYPLVDAQAIIHGASASVLAVITAVATLYPHKRIGLLFIGVVRLVWVVVGFLVVDILFASGTAVAAHIGGAATGFLFARLEQRGVDLSSWAGIFYGRRANRSRPGSERGGGVKKWFSRKQPVSFGSSASSPPNPSMRAVELDKEEDHSSEVDRILDKISEEGYEALTEQEKRALYEASRR